MSDVTSLFVTLPDAQGAIGPLPEQAARVDELTTRLHAGDFHVAVEAGVSIPVICIDGRYGGFNLLPNAAGGTETLMVADDLVSKQYAGDGTTLAAYQNVLDRVTAQGLLVGGHTDDRHGDGASGCGANDKLDVVYDFLATNGDAIRRVAESLGVVVSDEVFATIVAHAAERHDFSSGAELLAALEARGDTAVVEPLSGAHKEAVAVINTRANTTLDRQALLAEFGDGYQAFNVDVWSFEVAARVLSDDEIVIPALVAAMVFYNLAVAHVLGSSTLRVVVL